MWLLMWLQSRCSSSCRFVIAASGGVVLANNSRPVAAAVAISTQSTNHDQYRKLAHRDRPHSGGRMRRRPFISLLGGAGLALTASRMCLRGPPHGRGVPVARRRLAVASINEDKLIDRDALRRMADRVAAPSRLTCSPFWSHAVAGWCSTGSSRSSDEIYTRRGGYRCRRRTGLATAGYGKNRLLHRRGRSARD